MISTMLDVMQLDGSDMMLMIALKHLMFGVATLVCYSDFQMGISTSRKVVKILCSTVSLNDTLHA